MNNDSRYIVGIDLGTTNSAVYFIDTSLKRLTIKHFKVPQLKAAGEVDEGDLLPSFCYLPGATELPNGALELPWNPKAELAVGTFARDQGALVPGRLVASTKSWLSHSGVDREQAFLPWGSDLPGQNKSPVDVTALYLGHVRDAWNHRFSGMQDDDGTPCTLANQQVVVTIPASFDETARELTIEAARRAQYPELTLLEEPLAAFYAWLNKVGTRWKRHLKAGEKAVIIDVGGGTTDFSVVEMDDNGGLHRFAVGEHLLLGGDNIDISLARLIEQEWNEKLVPAEWSMLCQLCRQAKERLLEDEKLKSTEVTLIRRGSSVIAGSKTAKLTRERLYGLLDEGFYPSVPEDAPAPKRRGGIREMGLPYAAEPAVTLHLLHFLRFAARAAGDESGGLLYPNKILFNGGSMITPHTRGRIGRGLFACGRHRRGLLRQSTARHGHQGARWHLAFVLHRGCRQGRRAEADLPDFA
jgi:molecular chaperone DnaK (HSP70)